jgi:hypothetical protein
LNDYKMQRNAESWTFYETVQFKRQSMMPKCVNLDQKNN